MCKIYLLFLAFVSVTIVNGQEFTSKLKGQVLSGSNDVSSVHVSNKTSNKGTITDANGFFEITVKLLDTLVFSAVQFKKKEVVVLQEILDKSMFFVSLEDVLTELNEVVVKPYNLSGDLRNDLNNLSIAPVITAATENLPNANLKSITQSERRLYAARTWDPKFYVIAFTVKADPIFNYFSGRTKMLKKRVKRDSEAKRINIIRGFYEDSLFVNNLKIPKSAIDDFIYFCEVDENFQAVVDTHNRLKIWEYMRKKSLVYRANNNLD